MSAHLISPKRSFGFSVSILLMAASACLLCIPPASVAQESSTPNIVLIFADDLGYGDLGCYGEKRWRTPNLDSLAAEGVRFTDFHSSQPVCSASRASLLTGCYANRIGIHNALPPRSKTGINAKETTLAELLRAKGYATGMVGKWHLGDSQQFLPLQHGFDSYLGIPYSNDMWSRSQIVKNNSYPPLPLYDGNEILDADVDEQDQSQLTEKYKNRLESFIDENHSKPFFLYFAHTFPHVPLFAGSKFLGKSNGGLYGDVIEEFDDAVGGILNKLRQYQIEKNTLVLFSSDNGPWMVYGNHAGTAGPFRESKGTVFEGGTRVPFLAKWPGHIPAGTVQHETAMTIDILPTIAKIVQAPLPQQKIDGLDIMDLLVSKPGARCPHASFFHYYRVNELQAIRSGPWKLLLPHTVNALNPDSPGADGKPGAHIALKIETPQLYNLQNDPSESRDVSKDEPEALAQLLRIAEEAREELGDSLTKRPGSQLREPGRILD